MATVKWTERMRLGVPLLDDDHRVFIRFINVIEANAGFTGRREVTKNSLSVLGRCAKYQFARAKYHVAREEEVVRACGFLASEIHESEDAEFA